MTHDESSQHHHQPMLASEFSKQGQHMTYPCSVQPKLDGVRLLASRTGLNTRNGKEVSNDDFGGLGHALAKVLPPGVVLDGEMYKHGLGFEKVVSMFKRGDAALEYHVYDLMHDQQQQQQGSAVTYAERKRMLEEVVAHLHVNDNPALLQVHIVDTRTASSAEEVSRLHAEFAAQGYEGIMLRNDAGPYEAGKRSRHLQKLKTFVTDEFVITDVIEATGADKGTAVFVCASRHGDDEKSSRFRVRMRASREERRQQWEKREDYVGRLLTVQFQELSVKNSLPRFPVGICMSRDEFE